MSQLGQTRKYSLGADVFRFISDSGRLVQFKNSNLFDIARETGKLVDVARGRGNFFRATAMSARSHL
jgi:hypothetical protein